MSGAQAREAFASPRVAVLAHRCDEPWEHLWWTRADGRARVAPAAEHAIAVLTARCEQHRARPPRGAMIVIEVQRWSGWGRLPAGGG